MKADFSGVIPPMITPFSANGDVDYAAFAANIEAWNRYDLRGYLVCGSNGETAYLTEAEKLRLAELTAEVAAPGRLLLAGTGMETPRETVRLTNACAKAGIMAALVLTPCYYGASMSSAALIEFFTRVAEESDIPILIYNVPKFTHVNIKADAVAALAAHENIIGIKDSAADVQQLALFRRITHDQDFTIFVGSAGVWYPALTLEVTSGIHAVANCSPAAVIAAQRAFEADNIALAREIYHAVCPLNTAVTATYGIAGLKHACDLNGFSGGHVRSPLLPLSESDKLAVERTVREANAKFTALDITL